MKRTQNVWRPHFRSLAINVGNASRSLFVLVSPSGLFFLTGSETHHLNFTHSACTFISFVSFFFPFNVLFEKHPTYVNESLPINLEKYCRIYTPPSEKRSIACIACVPANLCALQCSYLLSRMVVMFFSFISCKNQKIQHLFFFIEVNWPCDPVRLVRWCVNAKQCFNVTVALTLLYLYIRKTHHENVEACLKRQAFSYLNIPFFF